MSGEHLGELAAFATTITWTIGIFPFTTAAKKLGPNEVNHFRLLLAVILLTIIVLITYRLSLQDLIQLTDSSDWLWFGLSGIVGLTLGDYFGFSSMAILGARRVSIFTTLAPTAVLISGSLIIGEKINLAGITGILISVSGVVMLTLSKNEKLHVEESIHGSYRFGIFCGLMSAICQGLGVVLANKGFLESGNVEPAPLHATWIRMLTGTAVLFLFTTLRGRLPAMSRPVFRNKENGVPYMIIGTIFGPVVGVSLSMYAISLLKDQPSVGQTIFSLMPIFALPIAAIFLKEKITLRSIVAVLIAVAGVIILVWRDDIMRKLSGQA